MRILQHSEQHEACGNIILIVEDEYHLDTVYVMCIMCRQIYAVVGVHSSWSGQHSYEINPRKFSQWIAYFNQYFPCIYALPAPKG